MRSRASKCLALAVAAMCLSVTAHAQPVPLELRAKLQKLQASEQTLLKARNELTELLNYREGFVLACPVEVDRRRASFPIPVPRGYVSAGLGMKEARS